MMRRSILFMTSSMRGGGSERQTLLLLKHLSRERFFPHLYLTDRAGELLSQVPDDVPVHSFDQEAKQRGIYFPGRVLHQQVSHLRRLRDSRPAPGDAVAYPPWPLQPTRRLKAWAERGSTRLHRRGALRRPPSKTNAYNETRR